ncbi:MAG: hypothetical protein M3Q07_22220 [Pseudobdellovibrionaceae bacterium]|nr:hypothetical protein [Pseudobdellovibrionaceae bacterium]
MSMLETMDKRTYAVRDRTWDLGCRYNSERKSWLVRLSKSYLLSMLDIHKLKTELPITRRNTDSRGDR